jgi:spore coat protein U-like protein
MHGFHRTVTAARAALAAIVLVSVATAAEAASCTVSASAVSFGTYNVFDTAPNDSTGTVTLNCNGGARNVAITISKGASPTLATRFMNMGLELLLYNLYQDASRTVIWGDGGGGSQMKIVDNPPNNKDMPMTIFARIPAGQDVSAGSYRDAVTVTVQY